MGEQGTYEVVYLDGDQETANFISRSGRARVTYPNGDVYEGGFNDEKRKHGENATYTFAQTQGNEEGDAAQPCVYTGSYVDGHRSGLGTMKYSDGSKYRGQWSQGLRHGKGAQTYANGDMYSGEWRNVSMCWSFMA